MEKNYEISRLLDFYGNLLNEKQRNTLVCYYEEDLSLSEIAENEGISRQGVSDSIRRGEQQLRGFEEKLHLLEMSISLEELSARLENVDDETKQLVDRISALLP